jgi:SagB-type dehydrogenase family enzyme
LLPVSAIEFTSPRFTHTESRMPETLPPPRTSGPLTVEEAIAIRRSVREFAPDTLDREQISQLLWATYGRTGETGLRAAPSAGALYPLELYVASADGLDRYDSNGHTVTRVLDGDLRAALRAGSMDQACVTSAPVVFVFTAVYERTCAEYGGRGRMFVHMDVGHAAQNLLLQAASLGLAGVPVAAFDPAELKPVLGLADDEELVYLVPLGRPL